jgi:hypothetical protein
MSGSDRSDTFSRGVALIGKRHAHHEVTLAGLFLVAIYVLPFIAEQLTHSLQPGPDPSLIPARNRFRAAFALEDTQRLPRYPGRHEVLHRPLEVGTIVDDPGDEVGRPAAWAVRNSIGLRVRSTVHLPAPPTPWLVPQRSIGSRDVHRLRL